jgi:flagellar hook protein FlgE
LQLTDSGSGGQLKTDFDEHFLDITTEGRNNAMYQTEARFFDERGVEHHLELTFERVGDNTWNMMATLDPSSGTVIDGEVTGITFDNRGGTPQVVGAGSGDADLSFTINGLTGTQTISVTLGTPGEFDGLTLLEGSSSIRHQQDGFPPGAIQSVEVDSDGILYGIATNDQRLALAQLAIASFENSQGLNADGENLFVESVNSGAPQVGPGADGDRGAVRGGRLESSNVDLAKEFTQLIIAQRGFSANARTITITDQILEELINIVR